MRGTSTWGLITHQLGESKPKVGESPDLWRAAPEVATAISARSHVPTSVFPKRLGDNCVTEAVGARGTRRKESWQQTKTDEHQSQQSRCYRKTIQKKLRNRSRKGTGKDAQITSRFLWDHWEEAGEEWRARRSVPTPLPHLLWIRRYPSSCTTSPPVTACQPPPTLTACCLQVNLACFFFECHRMSSTLEVMADHLESTIRV